MTIRPFAACALLIFLTNAAGLRAARTLDFYVIDVGQGNAMLVVSPSGRAMLLDDGPRKTADNVMAVMQEAGVKELDYVVISHYHEDHFGGTAEIAAKFKVRAFADHGPSVEAAKSEEWWKTLKGTQYKEGMGKAYDELYGEYTKAIGNGRHLALKAGDKIPFQGVETLAVFAAGKRISKPLKGGGDPNLACSGIEPRLEDYGEDGQSVGVLFTLGKFRFIQLGDLSWNLSNSFFCPNNPIGTVDAYAITHHARSYPKEAGELSWSWSSCPKSEVWGLRPRIAIGSLGSGSPIRRPDALQTVHASPGLEDVWQTRVVTVGAEKEYNAPEQFIANMGGRPEKPAYIKVSAKQDGSFTVTNSRTGFTKKYAARN